MQRAQRQQGVEGRSKLEKSCEVPSRAATQLSRYMRLLGWSGHKVYGQLLVCQLHDTKLFANNS